LKNDPDKPGKLMVDPNAKLEEELIVRPTSEARYWVNIQRVEFSLTAVIFLLINGS
jgi:hypothetical protein